jgi:hypothetical protein
MHTKRTHASAGQQCPGHRCPLWHTDRPGRLSFCALQVVRRPAPRQPQRRIQRFELLGGACDAHGANADGAAATPAPAAGAAGGAGAAQQAPDAGCAPACRWDIPAGGAAAVRVRFHSEDAGCFQETVTFEVGPWPLTCRQPERRAGQDSRAMPGTPSCARCTHACAITRNS